MPSFIDSVRLVTEPQTSISTSEAEQNKVEQKPDRFVRGPIPAPWIEQAAQLPGKALHAALAIRYLDGFKKTGTVKFKPSVRNAYGMDRHSLGRALDQLVEAGLVSVARKPGSAPTVTILAVVRAKDPAVH